MNSEALIKDGRGAIRIFREIFKATITDLSADGKPIRELSPQDIISTAHRFLETRQWYINEMEISDSDLMHFDAVMSGYLIDVQDFLGHYNSGNEGLPAALHQLFS